MDTLMYFSRKRYLLQSIVVAFCLMLPLQASFAAATVVTDPASQTCSPGSAPATAAPLVTGGDFATPHGGFAAAGNVIAGTFTASVPYSGDDIYAFDTSISIQVGMANYASGAVMQDVFPGDPANGVPALNTYLYSNGNNTGGPYTPWSQVITVAPNTEYIFVTYVSNMIVPGLALVDEPIITFFLDGVQLGASYTVINETAATGDVWTRLTRTFTTGPAQTSATLSFTDSAAGIQGDDLGFTAVGGFECAPVAASNNPPVADDDMVNTAEQTAVTINVLSGDTDADMDPLSITNPVLSNPANGTAVVNIVAGGSDTITYTPNPGFVGTDTFTYEITDGNGGSSTATVTVVVTMLPDFDMDGIPDSFDIDDDNDGILDIVEGSGDLDLDGVINSFDLDADGDGILDLEESGLNETEQALLDTDMDGQIDLSNNFGANGLSDDVETAAESGSPDYDNDGSADNPANNDGDVNADFLDLDSDNDAIPDVIEAGFVDADQDGQADPGQTPTLQPVDSDNDGVKDVHDLDSDNDGLTDALEGGSVDADGNGRVDGFADGDGDGYDDMTALNPAPVPNTDGDTVPDYLDLDSDNDGLTDALEGGVADSNGDGIIDNFSDADGDGYDDATLVTPATVPNTDGDSVPNYLDLDSDNDGLTDALEGGVADSNGDGIIDNFTDADGDGYDDATLATPAAVPNTDGDTVPNYLDLDSDNDGLTDALEGGLADTNGDGLIDNFTDADGDGYDDATTTAPAAVPNTDGDTVPDFLDLDSDNDGLTDALEGGLADTNGDGIVDNFSDADGDGYDDGTLATPATIPDSDGTGNPDYLDLDSDDDGLTDLEESGLVDADGDGLVDNFTDADGDGYDDAVLASPAPVTDTDGNGIPDFQEPSEPVTPPPATTPTTPAPKPCCILQTGLEGHGGSMGTIFLGLLAALFVIRRRLGFSNFFMPVALASLMLSSPLAAEDDQDFNGRLYLGLSAGISQLEPLSPCGCQFVDDNEDTTIGLHLGYDLTKRITLEAHYAELGEAGIGLSSTREHQGEVDYTHFGVSALVYLLNNCGEDEYDNFGYYAREGLSLYGRIGASNMDNDSSNIIFERQEDIHLHLGLGLEYGFANGFALRGEFISYDEDAKVLTLAIIKRFGTVRDDFRARR